jgi:hypothetical protein
MPNMSTLIESLGGPAEIARMCVIKPPSVIGWKGRIPKERCPDIERGIEGRVTVEQMRGDVRWVRVPDPMWPHPEGRPCIDVATPVSTEMPPTGSAGGDEAHHAM